MIKIEDRTSDKKLRIYRPDILLEDICSSNGFAIVLKMIPCFGFLKKLNDIEQKDPIKFNKEFDKKNHFSADVDPCAKFTFSYGVNVRTPRVKKILPFATAYIYDEYDNGKEGTVWEGRINKDFQPKEIDLTVPKFTDEFHIRELFLYADITDGVIKDNDIVILSLTTDDKKFDNNTLKDLKEKLADKKSFLTVQAKTLKIKKRVYLWLTSEDYNVNTAGDALSNIIAISDDFDVIESHIKPRRLDFINLLFLIKARYMFDTEIAQRKTAIASAKAAIMSRNMSHNLGSHVMAYLKQHLSSVQDMIRDNVLSTLFNPEDDITTPEGLNAWNNRCQQIINEQKEGLSEVALPFLVGLGKFISYLQERQDFIATIATNYIPYFSTVNFKDFIYDELNPDLRYKRHKDRIGLKPDNILLGNIARSEGLARKTNPTIKKEMSDIVLKYRHFDGEPVYEEDGKTLIHGSNIEVKRDDLEDMRDFMVSLPGGVVGRQAIFSIVENVVRNAAKHGKWGAEANKNLELIFNRYYKEDFDSVPHDYVPKGEDTIDIFLKKYYGAASDIDDVCIVTLTDNMAFEPRLNEKGEKATKDDCINLAAIRKALIEAYIDNASVEMLQTNKGIKEMRISAAWLRGIEDDVKINPLYITPDFVFDEKNDKEDHWINRRNYWHKKQWIGKAPVLMVRACTENKKEDYHLQYVFCLPKPKEVAIILSQDQWEKGFGETANDAKRERMIQHLSSLSWGLFDVNSYLKARNKSYEFIIVDDAVDADLVNKIRMVSPNRVFLQHEVKNILDVEKDIIHGDRKTITCKYLKQKKVNLFRILSHFDPSTDEITISDPKTLARIPTFEKQKSKKVNVEDGIAKARYLYRTHNETEQLFAEYLDATETYEDAKFVEGITGNNSTDRLVRNEILDDHWLYSHLHAMKTSVGIFDERIFAKIYKKDEADIVAPVAPALSDEKIGQCIERLYSQNANDPRLEQIAAAQSVREIEAILGQDFSTVDGDYMAIAFEKKKVSIFNMIKTADGLDIYGYGGCKREVIALEQPDGSMLERIKYRSIIEKVAEIKKGDDGRIQINKLKENLGEFDYLTIHQGLLDKIYEQFDIRRNPYQKHQFTKLFYETFCSHKDVIEYNDEKIKEGNVFYLPYLRIHSGRSKPGFADMPQHQPFMQYSAIEHAVMDCKYSLVELLDFARYEDDKSNNDL